MKYADHSGVLELRNSCHDKMAAIFVVSMDDENQF